VRTPPETELTADSTLGPGPRDAGSAPAKVGRYLITGVVGAGGMGVVFRAHDPQLQRDVAIKMPSFRGSAEACEAARQRFLREARAAGR
jgi:serine/threonine protein kinase